MLVSNSQWKSIPGTKRDGMEDSMKNRNVKRGKRRREKAREMWHFLTTQEAFRRAPVLTLFRSAAWYCRCLLRIATAIDLPRWNVRMFFPSERMGFGKFIFAFREYYEPELAYLEKILSAGKLFVDVGANFGVYTLVASKLVGETGRVLALEPAAQSFAILKQNIELNHFSNVRAFNVALAQTKSKAWLYHGRDPVGNSLGKDPLRGNEGEEVQTETLDKLLEENGIDRVDAIKIDVEGAEELVLRGAIRCLTTQSPIVIFEFNPDCAARLGLSSCGARDLLESLGYEFVLLDDCARSNNPESRPTYFNIVAIPKQSAGEFSRSFHSFRTQPRVLRSYEL
jgi:FkbM family methyltransferase